MTGDVRRASKDSHRAFAAGADLTTRTARAIAEATRRGRQGGPPRADNKALAEIPERSNSPPALVANGIAGLVALYGSWKASLVFLDLGPGPDPPQFST